MKLTITAPNFNEEWLRIRDHLQEVKASIEEKYQRTINDEKINNAIIIYFFSSLIVFLCVCFIPAAGAFAVTIKESHPIIYWALGCAILLGICIGVIFAPTYNYSNRVSKKPYMQSYSSILSTLEQLSKCTEFATAYKLWNKIVQLFLTSDSPWFTYTVDSFISKMNSLKYMESLTKVYELVSYTIIDNNMIAVTYAEENGDIHTTGTYPCIVKENTKIEIAELSWSEGKVILTRPLRM